MDQQIFRKKSLDRVSSPEQLNEYIRVSTPGVWLVLAAIIVLLAGVCVWGVLGRLETVVSAVATSAGDMSYVFIAEEDIDSVQVGMTVNIGEVPCELVEFLYDEPVSAGQVMGEYARHVGALDSTEWVYVAAAIGNVPVGTYSAEIVTESIAPMSFVLN